ncbi:protein takeout isoform X2 [Bemisia tabaci]|uniref:protein takeout isoform X2 n=1 Tax=Bemisia tabaci TaxID=7038 RepID=UPI003B28D6EE
MDYFKALLLAVALVSCLTFSHSAPQSNKQGNKEKQAKQGGSGKLHTLPLPSYIGKGCNPNLPQNEFNKCVVKKGQPAIEKISAGDPQYRVPKLDPFTIPSLIIDQGTKQVGMKMACTNCQLRGLKYTKFVAARADLKKRHVEWDFKLDKVLFTGQYKVSGQVLLLPLFGSGFANISLTGVKFTFVYDFDVVKKENGREYVELKEGSKLTFGAESMKIRLENLFNGDKLLGENMNTILNENWKDLLREIGPAVGDALASVFRNTLSSVAQLVPYDVLFPTK